MLSSNKNSSVSLFKDGKTIRLVCPLCSNRDIKKLYYCNGCKKAFISSEDKPTHTCGSDNITDGGRYYCKGCHKSFVMPLKYIPSCPKCFSGKVNRSKTKYNNKYKCYLCSNIFRKPKWRKKTKEVVPKKKTDDLHIITPEEFLTKIEKIKQYSGYKREHDKKIARDMSLIVYLYLTASRISEAIPRGNRGSTRETIVNHEKEKIIDRLPGITPQQIELKKYEGKQFLIFHNLEVLKRKKRFKRTCPVMVTNVDRKLCKILWDYRKERLKNGLKKDEPLFDITRDRALVIVKKHFPGFFSHYFRHLKCSHLSSLQNFSGLDLQRFVGWANISQSGRYAHYNIYTQLDKLIKNSGEK